MEAHMTMRRVEVEWRSTLAEHAFPKLGDRAVSSIDAALIDEAVMPIWTKTPETAWRVRGRNTNLSRDDKSRQRSKTAEEAIADFELSKALARAREAVELALVRGNAEDSAVKAMKELEQGWQRAMDKIAERAAEPKPPRGARRGALISGQI
jgi:hypothetical protein